jgi:DNA modification methylase
MLRAHVADGVADLAIADAPYWLSRYCHSSGADRNYALAGMVPRFDEEWDKFDSVPHYESVAEKWLMEVVRCLNSQGSAFIFGSYQNIGLINRICQMREIYIINQIAWVVRNSRPNAAASKLQPSHHAILWVAKAMGQYRFNYRDCKRRDYANDYFAERGKQLRDTWDIPAAPHENKRYGHPSPKPLAVYARCLDTAGKVGGLILDLFSGSGTGIVAAMRFGMESLSIEREPRYCDMIRRRVADEIETRPGI